MDVFIAHIPQVVLQAIDIPSIFSELKPLKIQLEGISISADACLLAVTTSTTTLLLVVEEVLGVLIMLYWCTAYFIQLFTIDINVTVIVITVVTEQNNNRIYK